MQHTDVMLRRCIGSSEDFVLNYGPKCGAGLAQNVCPRGAGRDRLDVKLCNARPAGGSRFTLFRSRCGQ